MAMAPQCSHFGFVKRLLPRIVLALEVQVHQEAADTQQQAQDAKPLTEAAVPAPAKVALWPMAAIVASMVLEFMCYAQAL
jgi:hypothetical protein